MQRINIYEKDSTTNQVSISEDVGSVYIPGFASGGIGLVGVPHECRTLVDFKTYFGSQAPKLKGNNYYPCSQTPSSPIDPQATKDAAELFLGLKAGTIGETQVTIAAAYNETTKYLKNQRCLQEDTINGVKAWRVYYATDEIAAPAEGQTRPWDAAKWTMIVATDSYITITNDETQSGVKTYYKYVIAKNTSSVWAGSLTFYRKDSDIAGFPEIAIPAEQDQSYAEVHMYKEGDKDPSWVMAYTLLSLGMPVTYVRMNNIVAYDDPAYDATVDRAYACFSSEDDYEDATHTIGVFRLTEGQPILDKGIYNVQFITSGGYPVLEHTKNIAGKMINLCRQDDLAAGAITGRGDCVALLDHTNNPKRTLIGANSVYKKAGIDSNYASIFTPWCYTSLSEDILKVVPPSFVYLYGLASRRATSYSWSIYAGVANGRCNIVSGLSTNDVLTNRIAESYQNGFNSTEESTPGSINAITYIRNYGYCIWGNRTCEHYSAGSEGFSLAFLNIRNLVSEVKKAVYAAAQSLMFEVNDNNLWIAFKDLVSNKLDLMVTGYGLEKYSFVKEDTPDKTKLKASIVLYPTYGLESIEITIDLQDNNEIVVSTETE